MGTSLSTARIDAMLLFACCGVGVTLSRKAHRRGLSALRRSGLGPKPSRTIQPSSRSIPFMRSGSPGSVDATTMTSLAPRRPTRRGRPVLSVLGNSSSSLFSSVRISQEPMEADGVPTGRPKKANALRVADIPWVQVGGESGFTLPCGHKKAEADLRCWGRPQFRPPRTGRALWDGARRFVVGIGVEGVR